MATRTVRIDAIYPSAPEERQRCCDCVRERLLATPGVRKVDLHGADADAAVVELDYDPRLIPLNELDAELRRAGVCCKQQRASVVLAIDGMVSPRSEQLIETALAKLPGVVA